MGLPQELIDEILSYLSLDDEHGKQSLRSCSLVAKSWINPSRRHLFETVAILELTGTLQSWLDSIPPANDDLLQHVRSLSLMFTTRPIDLRPVRHVDVLQDYFPFLHQLRHLSLSSAHLLSDIPQRVDLFSAFRHTLSQLSLGRCEVATSALGALIDYFPNLNRLNLSRITRGLDDEPVSPVSRPLVERLYTSGLYGTMGFLDQLSGLGLVFEEIVLDERASAHLVERVADAVGMSVKHLRLLQPLRGCVYHPPSKARREIR